MWLCLDYLQVALTTVRSLLVRYCLCRRTAVEVQSAINNRVGPTTPVS